MRSGSVRSCPRQLPPHLEMTLVYCSRAFSTLRSLYPRPYWSLTTGGGAARNSYKCKYICCCVILVLLCLLLSPVLAFLYHLFPFSFVRRSLSSSSVCLFVLVYFVVRAFDYTLCVLLRIRVCTCAVSFMLNFVLCLLDSNFIFSFCGCPFFSSSSGMVTTTQGMFSLLPIGRHLCSFARILGYGPRCFGLQRRQNCPMLSSAL